MNTLFDFVTHIKTVEYLMAVSFIALFIIYWEILKPAPFRKLISAGREDLAYFRQNGLGTVGKIAAAPFIGLAYIIALPVVFYFAVLSMAVSGLMRLFGVSTSFGWNPVEAYLSGKKNKEKEG